MNQEMFDALSNLLIQLARQIALQTLDPDEQTVKAIHQAFDAIGKAGFKLPVEKPD